MLVAVMGGTDPVELARMCGVTLDQDAEMVQVDKSGKPVPKR